MQDESASVFARKGPHFFINPLANPSAITISDKLNLQFLTFNLCRFHTTMVRPSRIAEIETNREIAAAASRCHVQMTEISPRVFKYTGGVNRAEEQNLIKSLSRIFRAPWSPLRWMWISLRSMVFVLPIGFQVRFTPMSFHLCS
eukprot:Blabericola_migrator_1__8022@NODE_4117_length_1324_cov_4_040573_g2547_i0_p2_GENE_NODE_4117_length_1324_cov_4_040573_g2547_i0NODE_4117_length_1324_cov_4_040573_g2547_i0_p2_ORF_typecomplete_len144_score10_29_NODE_4117_length_1324_cov_4_040573_g2547_i0510941